MKIAAKFAALVLLAALAACGGGEPDETYAECVERVQFVGPLQPGKPVPMCEGLR